MDWEGGVGDRVGVAEGVGVPVGEAVGVRDGVGMAEDVGLSVGGVTIEIGADGEVVLGCISGDSPPPRASFPQPIDSASTRYRQAAAVACGLREALLRQIDDGSAVATALRGLGSKRFCQRMVGKQLSDGPSQRTRTLAMYYAYRAKSIP